MTNNTLFSEPPTVVLKQPASRSTHRAGVANAALPQLITWVASKQTYYTIRLLVDRERVLSAFRAYAYFRWVDDQLDAPTSTQTERLVFLQRQQILMKQAYQGEIRWTATDEELLLVDLIQGEPNSHSGLHTYIENMMALMAFDTNRRGQFISQYELNQYSQYLAVAVTEALHYFMGHADTTPENPSRYLAVTGAHIVHMLRDTFEDVAMGYFNVPYEFLTAHQLDVHDLTSKAYTTWVKHRVELARACFQAGKHYLAQVKNFRCRIAGYAYIARFETVLAMIERESYQLRPTYLECKTLPGGLKMSWAFLSTLLNGFIR